MISKKIYQGGMIGTTTTTASTSQKVVGFPESHSKDVKNPPATENRVPPVPSTLNHPPSARDDRLQTETNNPIVAPILDNDADRDGNKLKIISVSSPTELKGKVIINQNGTITYLPATDFAGMDTFTYTISDSEGKTDKAKVLLIVKRVKIIERDYKATSPSILKNTPEEGGLMQTQTENEAGSRMTQGKAQDNVNPQNNEKDPLTSLSSAVNGSINDKGNKND